VVAADRVVDGEGLVVGYGRAGGRERERGRESSIVVFSEHIKLV
jgi:hypothetical protein